jgi:hypothetical protein
MKNVLDRVQAKATAELDKAQAAIDESNNGQSRIKVLLLVR